MELTSLGIALQETGGAQYVAYAIAVVIEGIF